MGWVLIATLASGQFAVSTTSLEMCRQQFVGLLLQKEAVKTAICLEALMGTKVVLASEKPKTICDASGTCATIP